MLAPQLGATRRVEQVGAWGGAPGVGRPSAGEERQTDIASMNSISMGMSRGRRARAPRAAWRQAAPLQAQQHHPGQQQGAALAPAPPSRRALQLYTARLHTTETTAQAQAQAATQRQGTSRRRRRWRGRGRYTPPTHHLRLVRCRCHAACGTRWGASRCCRPCLAASLNGRCGAGPARRRLAPPAAPPRRRATRGYRGVGRAPPLLLVGAHPGRSCGAAATRAAAAAAALANACTPEDAAGRGARGPRGRAGDRGLGLQASRRGCHGRHPQPLECMNVLRCRASASHIARQQQHMRMLHMHMYM